LCDLVSKLLSFRSRSSKTSVLSLLSRRSLSSHGKPGDVAGNAGRAQTHSRTRCPTLLHTELCVMPTPVDRTHCRSRYRPSAAVLVRARPNPRSAAPSLFAPRLVHRPEGIGREHHARIRPAAAENGHILDRHTAPHQAPRSPRPRQRRSAATTAPATPSGAPDALAQAPRRGAPRDAPRRARRVVLPRLQGTPARGRQTRAMRRQDNEKCPRSPRDRRALYTQLTCATSSAETPARAARAGRPRGRSSTLDVSWDAGRGHQVRVPAPAPATATATSTAHSPHGPL